MTLPPGRTDEDYVLALLRETGVLCVYGSGFGTPPEDGFFRVVFLASPAELAGIYDTMAEFTARYLGGEEAGLAARDAGLGKQTPDAGGRGGFHLPAGTSPKLSRGQMETPRTGPAAVLRRRPP